MNVDTAWCMTCSRHLENEHDLYCSMECEIAAHPSSPAKSPSTPTWQSASSMHSSTDERILAWRRRVSPGAPPSRSPSPSPRPRIVRVSSPTASSSSSTTPGRTRPKLLQIATSPVSPTVSLSFSPLQQRDRPLPASPANISSSRPRYHHPHHLSARHDASRRSSMTCTTALTSDDSVATPVTPAVAIPITERAPTDAHRLSLWKQVRSWVGPASPTPRVHLADGAHFPAYHRKHSALYIDEETLDVISDDKKHHEALPDPFAAREDEDDDDDDDEESVRSSGLAGWFAQRAVEQRLAKDAQASARVAQQAAHEDRGRKLERARAQASYYAVR